MAKRRNKFTKGKTIFFIVSAVFVFLILSTAIFLHYHLISNKPNSYHIKNNYYGFDLSTPKNWTAKRNMSYTDQNIAAAILECNKSKNNPSLSSWKIGDFKFEDQKYPDGFSDSASISNSEKTGAILEVAVSCVPGEKSGNAFLGDLNNSKIGGENIFEQFLNLPIFGKTKYIYFSHNNLQYKITEYVYVSLQDKIKGEGQIRQEYDKTFSKIISSFKFLN